MNKKVDEISHDKIKEYLRKVDFAVDNNTVRPDNPANIEYLHQQIRKRHAGLRMAARNVLLKQKLRKIRKEEYFPLLEMVFSKNIVGVEENVDSFLLEKINELIEKKKKKLLSKKEEIDDDDNDADDVNDYANS